MLAEFYDPNNAECASSASHGVDAALADLVECEEGWCPCMAFDATNSTKDRSHILKVLKDAGLGAKKMFVESVCDQDEVTQQRKNQKSAKAISFISVYLTTFDHFTS
jgi:hypothetical protein